MRPGAKAATQGQHSDERRGSENILALDDDIAPSLRPGDRVVEQATLVFSVAAHLIGPDDHDALELPVLGLLHRHRRQLMRPAATMLPSQRDLSRNYSLDLRTGEFYPSASVNLVFDPRQCRTHGSVARHRPQCSTGSSRRRIGREVETCDDRLRLVAVIAFPMDSVRPVVMFAARAQSEPRNNRRGSKKAKKFFK